MKGVSEAEGSVSAFNRCVRMKHVSEMTGIARSTIYKYIAEGTFPKPFKLGERVSVWRVSVIEQWITEREQT